MAQGPTDLDYKAIKYPNSLKFMENRMLEFLQHLFSMREKGDYQYNPDETVTDIYIEGQRTDNLRAVDVRPKITVARGPVTIQGSGINNFVGSNNLSQFKRKYTAIRQGSVGISCFSREELEADQLAEFIADAIDSLRPAIQMDGFLQVKMAQIGQRALIKSNSRDDLFVTPVLVQLLLTKNYTNEITDAVKLRKIIYEYYFKPLGLVIKLGEEKI